MNNQLSEPHKADMEMVSEMQKRIDAEMKKPIKDRDYDLIDRLTSAIYDAVSGKEIDITAAMNELHARQEANSAKALHNRWIKPVACMVAVLSCVLGLNTWSLHSYGKNICELAFVLTSSFTPADLAFSQEFEYSADDPYGIRAECEKYIPVPPTPTYIPEQLTQTKSSASDGSHDICVHFQYEHKKQCVSLYYIYFKDDETFRNTTTNVTADDPNHIFTERIQGHDVVMKWEDDSFEAIFVDGKTMCHVWTLHIPQEEAYKVLRSCFEENTSE